MNDKEYSFEDFFASGTGIESEKTETSSLSSEDFDGYVDGISMEIYQTNAYRLGYFIIRPLAFLKKKLMIKMI